MNILGEREQSTTFTPPQRRIDPDAEVVYVGGGIDPKEMEWTGITGLSWTRRPVLAVYDTGFLLAPGPGQMLTTLVEWHQVHLWRRYIVRRGQSKRPGRSWEIVERHYLYKIGVQSTMRQYNRAAKLAGNPDNFVWRQK